MSLSNAQDRVTSGLDPNGVWVSVLSAQASAGLFLGGSVAVFNPLHRIARPTDTIFGWAVGQRSGLFADLSLSHVICLATGVTSAEDLHRATFANDNQIALSVPLAPLGQWLSLLSNSGKGRALLRAIAAVGASAIVTYEGLPAPVKAGLAKLNELSGDLQQLYNNNQSVRDLLSKPATAGDGGGKQFFILGTSLSASVSLGIFNEPVTTYTSGTDGTLWNLFPPKWTVTMLPTGSRTAEHGHRLTMTGIPASPGTLVTIKVRCLRGNDWVYFANSSGGGAGVGRYTTTVEKDPAGSGSRVSFPIGYFPNTVGRQQPVRHDIRNKKSNFNLVVEAPPNVLWQSTIENAYVDGNGVSTQFGKV